MAASVATANQDYMENVKDIEWEKVSADVVESVYQKVKARLDLIDRLRECGVPKSKANSFKLFPTHFGSGYKMGELVEVYCGDKFIYRADYRQEYARSCKWKANHGYMVFFFTRKDLRRYVDICHEFLVAKDLDRKVSLIDEAVALMKKYFSKSKSTVSNKYYIY